MKPFCIDRNSWHYKMNRKMTARGDNRFYMEDTWEPKHSNFCAYWRTTAFKLIWLCMVLLGIGFILFILGTAVYLHPIESLKVAGAIVGVIVAFISVMLGFVGISEVENKIAKSDSIFIQKYRAHKSKICPTVEFK